MRRRQAATASPGTAAGVLSESIGRSETLYAAGGILAVSSLAVVAIPSIRQVRRAAEAVAEPATA